VTVVDMNAVVLHLWRVEPRGKGDDGSVYAV